MRARVKALMVGTDPNGKGGVAAVVTVLRQEGFFERHAVRYIVTHVQQSAPRKAAAMLRACGQLLGACAFGQRPLVHVHSASRASFYRKSLVLALARGFGCKTIFHLHGAEFQQFALREAGAPLRWWIKRTLERSDAVVALSDTWAAFLRGYAPRAAVHVVPNSVKLPELAPAALQEPARILFLGRAEKRKGIFELLPAVAALAADFPAIRLVVGGDGDLQAVRERAAELGIAGRLEVLGWIGAEQKAGELARAAIFTLPSHDEGLPMAMLEAMAAGKAIVVTPVGGIPEAVQDGVNGLLVAPGDPLALAAALRALMADPALGERLAGQARATIARRFSTDVVLGTLSAIYQQLSGAARR